MDRVRQDEKIVPRKRMREFDFPAEESESEDGRRDEDEFNAKSSFQQSPSGEHTVETVGPDSHNEESRAIVPSLQPQHLAEWASYWPEAYTYYTHNLPDYTGLQLYNDATRYPSSHRHLRETSPVNFTVQVLVSERARTDPPMQQLNVLKGWLLRNLNGILRDPSQYADHNTLNVINALALYELLFEESGGASTAHLTGFQLLLQHYGGFERMIRQDLFTSYLVQFVDGMHAYLQGKPRFIRASPGSDVLACVHPLRLALQPTRSGLPDVRLRNHLMMSYASPVCTIFFILGQLQDYVARFFVNPSVLPAIAPEQALAVARGMEMQVFSLDERNNELSHPIFSEEDRNNHRDTYRIIKLSTLVLVQRFATLVSRSSNSISQLDHHVQSLLLDLLSPHLRVTSQDVIMWALFIGGPLLEKDQSLCLRQNVIKLTARLCLKRSIGTWEDLHRRLVEMYFNPSIQEQDCRKFWREVYSVMRQTHPSSSVKKKSLIAAGYAKVV